MSPGGGCGMLQVSQPVTIRAQFIRHIFRQMEKKQKAPTFAKIIHRCLGLKVSASWACFWAPFWRPPSCRSAPTRCMWLCLWPRTTLSAASSSAPWATGSEASPPIGSGASVAGNAFICSHRCPPYGRHDMAAGATR